MNAILQGITIDRAVLVVFLAGTLWEKFKATRSSLRDQGKRIGSLEVRLAALEGKTSSAANIGG